MTKSRVLSFTDTFDMGISFLVTRGFFVPGNALRLLLENYFWVMKGSWYLPSWLQNKQQRYDSIFPQHYSVAAGMIQP